MEKFLRSNNFARLIAFFLAIILWLFVTGDKITRTTPARQPWQDVPLRAENLAADYVITDMPSSVDLVLEGLPENFEDLTIQDLDAFVDLSGKESGSHLVRVQGRSPRGLSVVSFEPEQARVVIEEYLSGDFVVETEVVGEPAEGWQLVDYTVEPEELLIGAPESIFEQIERIMVIIDLAGMKYVERIELEPTAYDAEETPMTNVLIDPESITVRLEFERVEDPEPEEEPEDEEDEEDDTDENSEEDNEQEELDEEV